MNHALPAPHQRLQAHGHGTDTVQLDAKNRVSPARNCESFVVVVRRALGQTAARRLCPEVLFSDGRVSHILLI